MILLHTADWHITEGPRLEDQIRTLWDIVRIAREAQPDLTIIPGDLYGATVPHKSTPLERNAVGDVLAALAAISPVIVVAGNHDATADADYHARLNTTFPIIVCSAADGIQSMELPGFWMHAIPYPRRTSIADHCRATGRPADPATRDAHGSALLDYALLGLAEDIRERPGVPHIVAGHLAVTGAAVAGGERLASREVEASTAALDQLRLAGASYIGLGHIHLGQEIGHPAIRYSGSPHRCNHGETEASKSVVVAEIADDGRFVGLNLEPVWHRRMVTVDAEWHLGDGWGWSARPADIKDAEVRLRLTIPDEAQMIADRDEIPRVLEEMGAHRVLKPEITIKRDTRVRAIEVARAESDEEKVVAYWDTLAEKPGDDARKEALAELDALERGEDVVGGVEKEIERLFEESFAGDHGTVDAEELRGV